MITFALNVDNPENITTVEGNFSINDLFMMNNGQLGLVHGVYSAAQSISNNIKLWLGEYDYNTGLGIPYGLIFNNSQNTNVLIEYQIRNTILSYNNYLDATQLKQFGVKQIKTLNFGVDQTTRQFYLSAKILMNNGTKIEVNI